MAYPIDLKLTVVRQVLLENVSVSDVAAKYGLSDACVRNWLKNEELTVSAMLEAEEARNLAQLTPPAGLSSGLAFKLYGLITDPTLDSTSSSHICRHLGVSYDELIEFGKSMGHSLETALNKSEQQNATLKQQVAALEELPKEVDDLKSELRKAKALIAEKEEMINFLKKLRAALKV